jgi:peptidoglycan/LPS O-acetylase OafA/YrhL
LNKPALTSSKIEVLDGLRCFAALSVCLFHFVCTTTGYVTNETVISVFSVGQYGVQLFFVISGFVIPWSMYHARYKLRNILTFLLKRFARLEPPYIFSVVLALAVLAMREVVFGLSNSYITISLNQVLLHLGYLIPFFEDYDWLNRVYWTLAVEFQYYLVIALIFPVLVRGSMTIRVLIYSAFGFLSFIGTSNFLLNWLPVFLLGILLFLYLSNQIGRLEYNLVTLITLLLCFYKYAVPAVVYTLIPLVACLKWPQYRTPLLHDMGRYSYSMYLVHTIIGASVVNYLSHRFKSPLEVVAVIALGIAITIFFSWLTYRFIERPSKSLSRSLKYQVRPGEVINQQL